MCHDKNIKAIIYESNAGHAESYAKMLGEKLMLPVFSLENCKGMEKKSNIIFIGWVMAGNVKGLDIADKKFLVKAVGMVSMAEKQDLANDIEKASEKFGIPKEVIFVLRGGFELDKLKGIYKLMMNIIIKGLKEQIEKKSDRTEKDNETYEMITKGKNLVNVHNLNDIIEWYNTKST